MNGQFPRIPGSPGIGVALVISFLIHGAVIVIPYLGQSAEESRTTTITSPRPPRIEATLMMIERRSPLRLPPPQEDSPEIPAAPLPPAEEPRQPEEPREGADLLPLEAPRYYPTEQLSVRPQPIKVSDLDPPEIRPILASGKMILKLWINDLGEVSDLQIEESDLPEAFLAAAAAAFKQMHFSPGQRDGKPVGSVMRIEVRYDDGRKPPEEAHTSHSAGNGPMP